MSLAVDPATGETEVLDTLVSDIQENIVVGSGYLVGKSKYVDSGPISEEYGSGNYLALNLSKNDFSFRDSVKVGLRSDESFDPVEIIGDVDQTVLLKIEDKYLQKLVVVQSWVGNTSEQEFELFGLDLLPAVDEEESYLYDSTPGNVVDDSDDNIACLSITFG